MASNTSNLGLLKKDPLTDGKDTFNIRTMLNDNWDKIDEFAGETTPISRGGTGATTAEQALANLGGIALGAVGNLHVWERVQTYSEEVPAGYTLGEKESTKICEGGYSSNGRIIAYTGTEISVDKGGNVTLGGTTDTVDDSLYGFVGQTNLRGKYVRFKPHITGSSPESQVFVSGVFYVPNDANCTFLDGSTSKATSSTYGLIIDKLQAVKAYPAIPAGTTTDYLTSTDRNAYPDQSAEGGQDAYYTLGDITNDCIVWQADTTNSSSNYHINVNYGDSIHIDSNGTISIDNPSTASLYVSNSGTVTEGLVGKYVYTKSRGSGVTGGFETGMVYYIPESATVSHQSYNSPYTITISEVQSVTGHAAIPANTTITYLGQLGGGARIEVGSYVGTGTYGKSNPNSLTFGFEPKFVLLMTSISTGGNYVFCLHMVYGAGFASIYAGDGNNRGCIVTWGDKSVTWYATYDATCQLNPSGRTTGYIAIG